MKVNTTVWNDETETEVQLPTRKQVCPNCRGEGSHNRHLGAYTADELDEQFGDGNERDEFFSDVANGLYARRCEVCEGLRVIDVVDCIACDPALLALYDEEQRGIAEDDAIHRAEVAAGA